MSTTDRSSRYREFLRSRLYAPKKRMITQNAMRGGRTSIMELARFAGGGLDIPDVETFAKVYMHHLTGELRRNEDNHDAESSAEPVSPAMLAAMEGLDGILNTTSFWTDPSLFHTLCSVLDEHPSSLDSFCSWTSAVLHRCLTAYPLHHKLVGMIDYMYWSIFAKGLPTFRSKIVARRDVVGTLTNLWLLDIERGQVTKSVPQLQISGTVSISQFVTIVGGTDHDFARICLQHLRMAYLHPPTESGNDIATADLALLTTHLFRSETSMAAIFAVNGAIPLYVEVIETMVERTLAQPTSFAVPDALTVTSRLLRQLSATLLLHPSFIVENVDSGIIQASLSTSVFWTVDAHGNESNTSMLGDLAESVEFCLATIRRNLFWERLIRHVEDVGRKRQLRGRQMIAHSPKNAIFSSNACD